MPGVGVSIAIIGAVGGGAAGSAAGGAISGGGITLAIVGAAGMSACCIMPPQEANKVTAGNKTSVPSLRPRTSG